MYLKIQSETKIDLAKVKVERVRASDPDTALWLYTSVGNLYMDQEAARELVRQIREALGDEAEPAKPEPETPQHPGWVFVDKEGDVWGWDDDFTGRSPLSDAKHPFHTSEEAADAGAGCYYGCTAIREWRPGDRVPPMPAPEAAKAVRYRVIDKDGDVWFRNAGGVADVCAKRHFDSAPTFATRAEAADFIARRSFAFAPYTIVEVPA